MTEPLKTAVAGATGYAGFELARILLRHPKLAEPLFLSREAEAVSSLEVDYPRVSGNGSHPVLPFSWELLESKKVGLLFLATPHEVSWKWVPEALKRGIRVVDLSGAWRLKQAENQAIYSLPEQDGADELLSTAVYGLPELHKDAVKSAQLVANPGCYASSVILALAPFARAGVLDTSAGIICDCKSGVSGAGKQSKQASHFVEVADNFSAYSVFGHRHTGEILEQLGLKSADLVFTPHLLPISRGILSTIYLRLKTKTVVEEIENLLRTFYAGARFVRIFKYPQLPQIQYSVRTNFCDIGFALSPDGLRVVLVSCIDNLMKGAAGQAVQNMNLMFGWDEAEGLN